jgi:hypothetical protein
MEVACSSEALEFTYKEYIVLQPRRPQSEKSQSRKPKKVYFFPFALFSFLVRLLFLFFYSLPCINISSSWCWSILVLSNRRIIKWSGSLFITDYRYIKFKMVYFDIVACRPVSKRWLCKHRSMLGNASNIQARNNRTDAFSVRSVPRGYKRVTV